MSSQPPASSPESFSIPSPESSQSPITLHAQVTRDPSSSSQPTIINLHYWGGSASTYHHIPAQLRAHNFTATIVSLSHRGWGSSGHAQPDTASAYSIAALASDVVAVLPQLVASGLVSRERGFVLCGHSMGAKVALAVSNLCLTRALTDSELEPEMQLPPLRGLLLLAPAPPGPLVLSAEECQQRGAAYDTVDSVRWTAREVLTGAKGEGLHGGTSDLEMIVRDSLAGSEGARKGWLEVGVAEDVDVHPMAGRGVKVRVLVARGDQVETAESVERDTVESLKRNGVDVAFRIIEPQERVCGHLLPLEAPGIVAEELAELLHDVNSDR